MTVSGPAGWLLRRCVLAPLVFVLAALLLVGWAVTALLTAVQVVLVGVWSRRLPRMRVLRLLTMAVAYALGECLCMVSCLVLWLCSGAGLWSRAGWVLSAHRSLLRGFLGALLRLSAPVFGFRVAVEDPRLAQREDRDVPRLVLARHAGPGASFALAHLLMSRYRPGLHVVLKDTLRLDPAIDLLLTRTGCTWVGSRGATRRTSVDQIRQAASELAPNQTLLLFPEGADWTPVRHLAAVAKLRRRGLVREARAALRMPHVLPPRSAGATAALRGAPGADVLIFTHTGHEDLLDAQAAWDALPLNTPLRFAWWQAPSHELHACDDDELNTWLQRTWHDIDAWVGEQRALEEMRSSTTPSS